MQDLLIAGGLSKEDESDFLRRMRVETERVHQILRDLLQFARPASTSLGEAAEAGDVSRAVQDALALLAPQKALHSIELTHQIAPDLPRVGLSHDHLMQLLLNLVLNAADACTGAGRILVKAELVAGEVELSVEDSGPGVAPEVRPRLFEPFITTKEPGQGTGLGLAVCQSLVEAAGGELTLDETYVKGARFVAQLPRAELEPSSGR